MKKPSISLDCPQCNTYQTLTSFHNAQSDDLTCPQCRHPLGKIKNPEDLFDYCPICDCRQFYTTKDFNQFFGCLIMLIGIVLVPWTYGLSLPVFAFVDWLLRRRVKEVTVCYKCGTEFRNIPTDRQFKPFLHHIGLKYDKFR